MYSEGKIRENPLEWETLHKFLAHIQPIMIICRLLNCSLHFYAYMFLRYRNRRAENHRRQKRQKDREMKMGELNVAHNTNEETTTTKVQSE